MDKAAALLQRIYAPGEGATVARELQPYAARLRELADRVEMQKVDPAVARLFRADENGDGPVLWDDPADAPF